MATPSRAARAARRRMLIEQRKLETKRRLAGEAAGPPPVPDPTAPGHRVRPTSSPRAARRAVWNLSTLLAIDTMVSVQGRPIEQRIALAKQLVRARARAASDDLLRVLAKQEGRRRG